MVKRQIEKVVAVHFLEATKEVLEHLSRWTVDPSSRVEAPKGLGQLYGSARRLRDYLQRCVSAYPQIVEIDLSEDDENLLVSCGIHTLGRLDTVDPSKPIRPEERGLNDEKKRLLIEWCQALATRPPQRIPVPNKIETTTPTVRGVIAMINKRFGSPNARPMEILKATFGPNQVASDRGERKPLHSTGVVADFGSGIAQPMQQPHVAPTPQSPPLAADRWAQEALARESLSELAEEVAKSGPPVARPRPSADLIDSQRLRDPRLRSMALLDLRAFDRAHELHDHRLALVHLGSIFEGAVIDYALSRRKELELTGSVETWSLELVLRKALADRFAATDKGRLVHLVAARTLIRPALQLQTPIGVTATWLAELQTFARRIFAELGLIGSGGVDMTPGEPAVPEWLGGADASGTRAPYPGV